MKLNIFKFTKDNLPPLESLRPQIFNADLYWFACLGLGFSVFTITALIGLQLFYSQYFETYKKNKPSENLQNIINVESLKSAVEKREAFVNQKVYLPKDPSI
jgi:hypothetical protein